MKIDKITPELYLIYLDQPAPGFQSFIGAWLYKNEHTFLVDVGPASTIPQLLQSLEQLNVDKLDAILITHIHIDHSGGLGDLLEHFPETPVVCHSMAVRHLVEPSRLWEGSLKTLGKTAEMYGPIKPVDKTVLCDAETFKQYGIIPFITSGHAAHHVSYLHKSILFAGETGGVFIDAGGKEFYLRPATPPTFFLETAVNSLDTLIKVDHDILCYGHFGATKKTPQRLKDHRDQLYRWAEIIGQEMKDEVGPDFAYKILDILIRKDPLLSVYHRLPPDVQDREKFFLLNSIRGFIGYLEKRKHHR